MMRTLYLWLSRLFLCMVIWTVITACQSALSTVQPAVANRPTPALPETATLPLETPAAAPTQIGSWPLSPDRHWMVAQTQDGAWWMWDAASRRPLYLLNDTPVRAPPIHNPTFSPDGHFLAAISIGRVLLWEVATRKRRLLMPPMGKDYRVMRRLVFSPDSQLLATSSCEKRNSLSLCDEGYVNLWNTTNATLAHTLVTGFRVDTMEYSADGTLLTLSGCSESGGVADNYCYEQSQAVYNVDGGELIALTRIPQFR